MASFPIGETARAGSPAARSTERPVSDEFGIACYRTAPVARPKGAAEPQDRVARRLPVRAGMTRSGRIPGLVAALGAATSVAVLLATSTLGGALPGPLPLFPPDNWWNLDV